MKIKIFLMTMMILFAVSCAKNNPANPVASVEKKDNNTEVKVTDNNNTEIKVSDNDNNTILNNTGKDDKNYKDDKNDIPSIADDGASEYKGTAELTIETLDSALKTKSQIMEIYVDISKDKKTVLIHTEAKVHIFTDVKVTGTKYEAYKKDNEASYMLSMYVDDSSITDFNLTIIGTDEKYYIKAHKLDAVK